MGGRARRVTLFTVCKADVYDDGGFTVAADGIKKNVKRARIYGDNDLSY